MSSPVARRGYTSPPMNLRALGLGAAFAVAFSPVLADVFRHWAAEPWARYSLLFAPLLIRLLARPRIAAAPAADGWVLLLAAVVLEVLALSADAVRVARPALALGALGVWRVLGLGPATPIALVFWLVPLPHLFAAAGSPIPEQFWAELALPVARALAPDVSLVGSQVSTATAALELRFTDGGQLLMALLSGLGWYAAVLAGARPHRAIARAIAWAALALPLQLIATGAAIGLTCAGGAGAARKVLDAWVWVVAVPAVAGIEWRRSGARLASDG